MFSPVSRNGIQAGTISWSKAAWLLIALVSFWHLFAVRLNGDNWKSVIASDGAGYYAYLPATFIHHDLNYQFAEENSPLYQSYPGCDVHFFGNVNAEGKRINKYFIGTSILQAPFFLVAYFLSSAFDYPPGGYSFLFQASVCFAAIFYLLLGLHCIRKLLLKMKFSDTSVMMTLLLLFFGTNLYHYALEEPSMSHIYSFGMIAVFLLSVFKLKENYSGKRCISACVSFALVILIRPTNGLIVLFVPFFISWQELKNIFSLLWKNKKTLAASILIPLLLFFLQSLVWKISSGHWKEDTYIGEGFDLLHPHLADTLFSWRKGMLIYTPLLLFSIAGLFFMRPLSKKLIFLGFLLLNTWIISSWHDWSYGGSFGQRPFVDTYSVFAIGLVFFLDGLKNAFAKLSMALVATFFVFLNLFQVYQYHNAILPYEYMTWNKYKRIFLESRKIFAGIYPPGSDSLGYLPAHSRFICSKKRTFENGNKPDENANQFSIVENGVYFSAPRAAKLGDSTKYCADLFFPVLPAIREANAVTPETLPDPKKLWVKACAKIRLEEDATDAKLVISFKDENNNYEWNGFYLVHRIDKIKSWQEYSFAIPMPEIHNAEEVISVYVIKGDEKLLYVDDLEVSIWEAPN